MTTLALLRHAKAVSDAPEGDRARGLSTRGRAAAAAVGTVLARLIPSLDLALVSDARRTQETAQLALASWSGPLEIRLDSRLYAASAETILAALRRIGPEHRAVLVVGHNPGIGELARLLAGKGEAEELLAIRERFPTAAVAILDLGPLVWSELRPQAGALQRFVTPIQPE